MGEIVISDVAYRPIFAQLISKPFITCYILGESPEGADNESEVTFAKKNFPASKYREYYFFPPLSRKYVNSLL